MPPTDLEAVLFDLDGTLMDHRAAANTAVMDALGPVADGQPLDRAHVTRRWADLDASGFQRFLRGELTLAEERRERVQTLAAELGLGSWSGERADAWFAEYLRRYEAGWTTFPDAHSTVAALAERSPRLRLGVITNGGTDQQHRKLRHAGLSTLLPDVTISEEAGAAKPEARIFLTACERLGLPPSRVAYVGDRLATDAEAATRAGLHGIWLDRDAGDTTTRVPRITTLAELPSLLPPT